MPLLTILVEDNPTIRESLIPALQEFAGVQILAIAETVQEAIAVLDEHATSWQLAIVDGLLRGGNGLEVIRSITPRREGQHVVMLTNYATPDIRHRAIQAGADAVFDKSTELEPFFALCASYAAPGPAPR